MTLFVNVLLFYRRLSKGSDYIHLKTYELSFNLSIHSSLKGPYNRSYEKNSFENQNEKKHKSFIKNIFRDKKKEK